ncbi:MAG: hypothetical protein EAX86_10645 [Candidatus Heimdallarchaeota archaeon]|nr:hypothetical protein [Candidatus Heimdallarchaeota archaeon]
MRTSEKNLRQQIEEKEVYIQAELLKARKERALIIEEAKDYADALIRNYKSEKDEEFAEWRREIEKKAESLLFDFDEKEKEKLDLIERKWKEKSKNMQNEILKKILPEKKQHLGG